MVPFQLSQANFTHVFISPFCFSGIFGYAYIVYQIPFNGVNSDSKNIAIKRRKERGRRQASRYALKNIQLFKVGYPQS